MVVSSGFDNNTTTKNTTDIYLTIFKQHTYLCRAALAILAVFTLSDDDDDDDDDEGGGGCHTCN